MENWLRPLLEDAQPTLESTSLPPPPRKQKTMTPHVREAVSVPSNPRQDGVAVGRPPRSDPPGLAEMLADSRYSQFALHCLFPPRPPKKEHSKHAEKCKKPGQRRK
ncbi:MAG: hypothetical protein A2103_04800 [Gammaproteobacteria bacterium GWF2_41_13]|nr:MAG: hypothetical protein A2103_04800 [Gammaproteobacteria bacterium GWF2_41_13]